MLNKIFVYGTLLQGENRNNLLADWDLLDAFEIEGTLYDTNLGYPAADFSDKKGKIFGELYNYDKDDLEASINTIDLEEGTDQGLFERIIIESNGSKFFTYNISSRLISSVSSFSKINYGNWRQYNFSTNNDVSTFAIDFEIAQSKRYEVFPPDDSNTFVHIKGDRAILVLSSHGTAHKREGKLKAQEFYTGAISVILNSISGVHSLYTIYASEYDSNYYEKTDLKKYIREVVKKYNIKFVLDIHGTGSYRKFDLYPGIGKYGEFLNGNSFLLEQLQNVLHKNNIKLGGTDVFPAYRQHTVSRFVNTGLGIPAMQIEINQKHRDPEADPNQFNNLINTLNEYLAGVGKCI